MTDHANPAADILPRSVWEAKDGERIRVLDTGGGYVAYVKANGAARHVHHSTFRREYQPLYDRRAVKSQFSMTCSNLAEFKAYWLPGERKLVARSVSCQREFRVPAEAVLIGHYAHGIDAEAFLKDLDCVISQLAAQARRSAAI